MTNNSLTIGQQVVRSKGDYVVGRIGIIISIENNRALVKWDGYGNSKVSLNSIELTSIPYEIKPSIETKDRFGYLKLQHPKYIRL